MSDYNLQLGYRLTINRCSSEDEKSYVNAALFTEISQRNDLEPWDTFNQLCFNIKSKGFIFY